MVYRVYRRRWLILVVVCVLPFVQVYSFNSFVILNNVVSAYYRVWPYQTDMLATIGNLVSLPVGLASAFFADVLTLRMVLLGSLASVLCGTTICGIGFLSRSLFLVTACGRVIMSSTFGMMFVLQAIMAAKWFPQDETAIAFALPFSMITISSLISAIVFPFAIPHYNETRATLENNWMIGPDFVKFFYSANFFALGGVMLLCTAIAVLYASERPPTPPSRAEEEILLGKKNDDRKVEEGKSRKSKLTEAWKEIKTPEFAFLVLASCLSQSVLAVVLILLPSAILDTFPHLDNTVAGKILFASTACSTIFILLCAKLLDKFKIFKPATLAGNMAGLLACIAVYFGHRTKCLWILCAAYPVAGIGFNVFFQSVVEFLLEATYPANNLLLMSLQQAGTNMSIFLFTLLGRVIMSQYGAANGSLVAVFSVLLSILAVMCVKPRYKRLESNALKEKEHA